MKKVIHKADSRGHVNLGWLNSYHSFSFSSYNNPEKIRFGALRVLNDDSVAPGKGFGQHPHENMEIISIPLSGALKHRDTTGREAVIRSGDVQIMSAGTGLYHAEMNNSSTEEVKFLQIWIYPKEKNIAPRYDQKSFNKADWKNQWQLVVSPIANDQTILINQDAYISLGNIEKGHSLDYQIKQEGNGVYIFILEGKVSVDDELLDRRDAIGITAAAQIKISAADNAEILLLEIPV